MKRIAIVGATSAIAEHCARIWLAKGAEALVLIARDEERVSSLASDLVVRHPEVNIHYVVGDFETPRGVEELVSQSTSGFVPDCVLIAHGSLPDQEACQRSRELAANQLNVNAISPALFAESFAEKMLANGGGVIGLIGSVAGDRGRKSNYVYGAAKGMLARYAEGMQHRLANHSVSVTLIKPGPTKTPMTAHMLDGGMKFADVESVSAAIVNGMEKRKPIVYAPSKWMIIMLVIRHLPRFIFNRMDI